MQQQHYPKDSIKKWTSRLLSKTSWPSSNPMVSVPLLQRQSGNPKIQVGQLGYFEAASVVPLIEKPERLDRSMGDVHAAGNPHIHLDPRNIAKVAAALGERMAALDRADHVPRDDQALDLRGALVDLEDLGVT